METTWRLAALTREWAVRKALHAPAGSPIGGQFISPGKLGVLLPHGGQGSLHHDPAEAAMVRQRIKSLQAQQAEQERMAGDFAEVFGEVTGKHHSAAYHAGKAAEHQAMAAHHRRHGHHNQADLHLKAARHHGNASELAAEISELRKREKALRRATLPG